MELKDSKKYKKTDVGMIPSDWEVKNLSDNFTLKARIGWQGLTTAEYLETGDFGLVTGTDFKNGYIDWDNCVYVEKNRFIQDKNIQLKIRDVLVTKDGTIGKVAFVDRLPNPTTLNSGVFVVRPKNENINNRFFYYLLMSSYFDIFLAKITAGSTITHLYQKDFVTFNFAAPTLAEQTLIANALSDADALISSLEQLIAKKKLIKQGAMQQLLKPKKGWEVKKLGEVCNFYKGKGLPKSHIIENGKFKCIHYGELFTKYKERITNILSYTNESQNVFYSVSNDVLMPTSDVTPYGLATASCIKETGVILGGDVLVIRIPNEVIDGIFLSYYISVNRERIMKMVTGSTVYHLYGSDMANFEVSYPKIDEQINVAATLSDMDTEIATLETKLDKYRKIKQGMMQNLLTGKVRLV
jgi:type I restriction enzyme S subunit